MIFALNYSPQAAELLRQEKIRIDRFKCPAWPELIAAAGLLRPVHIHFPLKVGSGQKDAVDTETRAPADWSRVESLLRQTETPWVNLHLGASAGDCPDIPVASEDPAHLEMLFERAVSDVLTVTARFGPERVLLENLPDDERRLRLALRPEFIRRVVEATGCGFLFDLSHARLAARALGLDVYAYMRDLPLAHTREIHVTGIQRFEGRWLEQARRLEVDPEFVEEQAGQWLDHLPMTEPDWDITAWALEQARGGQWGQPGLVSLEYGGVGFFFEAVTETAVLAADVPRLYGLVKNGA